MPPNQDHYALVVGIDHYPDFRPLQGASNDANDFRAWLVNPEGGGLLDENLELVLSKVDPVRPIHDDIDDALLRLLSRAGNREGNKRLYLYFSGHGLGRSNLGTDLCLPTWSKQRRGRALATLDYVDLLMGCGCFSEVIVLLDCCRIREIRTIALRPTFELPKPGDEAPKCRSFVGYATEFMNAAFEADTGQVVGDSNVRGHFTRALLDALNGAAADPAGGVRASKLKEYLEVHTPRIAVAKNQIQYPEVVNGLSALNDPLFGLFKPPIPVQGVAVIISFKSVASGVAVIEDGQLRELRRGDVTTGPWRIPISGRTMLMVRYLPKGTERVVRVEGNEKDDLHVEF